MATNILRKFYLNMGVLNRPLSLMSILRLPRISKGTNFNIALSQFSSIAPVGAVTNDAIDIQAITGGDPKLENKLKVLILETDLLRQSGYGIPDKIKAKDWKILLQLNNKTKRQKYLLVLFKNEKTDENKEKKKVEKRKQREEYLKNSPEMSVDDYCLKGNSLHLRIYDTTINHVDNGRLLHHSQFTQPLVLDCSFERYMTNRECSLTAKQLALLFGFNRVHKDPFDLHLCNISQNSKVMNVLSKHIPIIKEPYFPMHTHAESYLDIFPKERLVYLTPDCLTEMKEFDQNAIFIIGCIVDKGSQDPLTLAKAKKEGIRMAKFPIDRYLEWGTGANKTLTLNQIVDILLDKRLGLNWIEAFKHIPRRKLASVQLEAQMKKYQKMNSDNYDTLIKLQDTLRNNNISKFAASSQTHPSAKERASLSSQIKKPQEKFEEKQQKVNFSSLFKDS